MSEGQAIVHLVMLVNAAIVGVAIAFVIIGIKVAPEYIRNWCYNREQRRLQPIRAEESRLKAEEDRQFWRQVDTALDSAAKLAGVHPNGGSTVRLPAKMILEIRHRQRSVGIAQDKNETTCGGFKLEKIFG